MITYCLPFFRSFGILISKLEKRGCFTWHMLLTRNVLVVVPAKANAQFLQLAKGTIDTLSMQNFVSIAVHALVFAQLKHQIQRNQLT